jgi:hypothetical protein
MEKAGANRRGLELHRRTQSRSLLVLVLVLVLVLLAKTMLLLLLLFRSRGRRFPPGPDFSGRTPGGSMQEAVGAPRTRKKKRKNETSPRRTPRRCCRCRCRRRRRCCCCYRCRRSCDDIRRLRFRFRLRLLASPCSRGAALAWRVRLGPVRPHSSSRTKTGSSLASSRFLGKASNGAAVASHENFPSRKTDSSAANPSPPPEME